MATPNFRHPVTLARDALALDDLSDGRFDLGVGPGSAGPDATALGQAEWSVHERMDRFEEFLQILHPILDGAADTRTTITGRHYASVGTPSTPGAVQTPFPLTVAAGGRRGLTLAALHGRQWVTIGPTGPAPRTNEAIHDGRPCADRSAAECLRGARARPCDDRQGAAVDADGNGHDLRGPVRRVGRPL